MQGQSDNKSGGQFSIRYITPWGSVWREGSEQARGKEDRTFRFIQCLPAKESPMAIVWHTWRSSLNFSLKFEECALDFCDENGTNAGWPMAVKEQCCQISDARFFNVENLALRAASIIAPLRSAVEFWSLISSLKPLHAHALQPVQGFNEEIKDQNST